MLLGLQVYISRVWSGMAWNDHEVDGFARRKSSTVPNYSKSGIAKLWTSKSTTAESAATLSTPVSAGAGVAGEMWQ